MSTSLDGLKTALADRYALEGEIGAGGMATVYLAEDLKHHRSVAVKVLRPELAASLGPERFVREIAIAASLTHPHILMLFDSGEAAGFLYYVMPYVDGESLRDRLDREGRLSVSHTVRIADQVASALHYAHERGVVHRDIKPENILLAGDQAVVADFGIARAVAVAGAERLTRTGLAIGTPQYMSPEQALGESDIDGRSDVYSLACIVYEMVAGRQLFEGSSPQALVAKHVASTAPGLRTIDPELPLFVDRAVARALAKEPAGRFETAAAFAEALTTETVVAPVGRRRLAVLPPVNLTNDPEQAHLVMGLHEALISQLGHGHVAVLARSSVLQYQGTEKPAREIARELGVQSIIESSLFRANDTIGVQARLIDGETEEGLWSGSYDGDVGNLFGLYRDLAGSIAKEIQVVLAPPESRPSHETRTIDPAAYEAYMRGRMHQERFSPAEFDVAMEYYQTAIAIDPNYAAAYSGIALIWGSRIVLGLVPPHEGGPEWKKAALKAVALDPTLAEARQALAQAYTWYDWDWPAAETEFLQAIALGPKEPQTRTFYAHFLSMMMRREEASAQMQKALDIDPYNPFTNLLAGALMLQGGQWQEGLAQMTKVQATAPNPLATIGIGWAHYQLGDPARGISSFIEYFTMLGDAPVADVLRQHHAAGDWAGAARAAADVLAERSRTTFVKPMNIAILYDWAGDLDRAMEWLDRSYDLRDHEMAYLSAMPPFSPRLRADPRFQGMLDRLNLPG